MNKQQGLPAVAELEQTMLTNVRYVIPRDHQNNQAETIDPATISRATAVVAVVRDTAWHF